MLFGEEAYTPHLKQEAEYVAQEVKGSCVSKVQGTELTEGLGKRFKRWSLDWLTFIPETRDTRDAAADAVTFRSIFTEVVLAQIDLKPVRGLRV